MDYVLHQAALGSVLRSINDPVTTNAASSSTYGDHPALPKVEDAIGKPLSRYAVTKYVNELYADVFARTYGFKTIGLRYFNVFGQRQDPNGGYAAVIPKWAASMIAGEPVYREFRAGDVRHSQASIEKAADKLGYVGLTSTACVLLN